MTDRIGSIDIGGTPAPTAPAVLGGPTFGGGATAPTTTVPAAPAAGPTFGGGSSAQATPTPTPTAAAPKPGYNNSYYRDTTMVVGGLPGTVNTCHTVISTVGKDNTAFEWAGLDILNNYADKGENVARYMQANKFGRGPTWGAVIEMHDHIGEGDAIGCELDIWTPTPDHGSKIAFDVCLAGTNKKGDTTTDAIGATAVLRGTSSRDNAVWSYGTFLTKIKECGHFIQSLASGAVRGIQLSGKFIVGIDLSTAQTQSAIRLAPGQRMTFEPTDQISWSWLDGRLRVQNGAVSVLEFDTTTGDIYKRGVKVL